jgi:hypothetical protein
MLMLWKPLIRVLLAPVTRMDGWMDEIEWREYIPAKD